MPRQNRVTPFGELIATNARGSFMGNRGVLHDAQGVLTTKRWTHNHWIICRLEFKRRKRQLMSPGCYTKLFFTDEAVAMAAGHRPCAECRREEFNRFKAAWIEGNAHLGYGRNSRIGEIDRILHKERVACNCKKVACRAALSSLPAGAFLTLPGAEQRPLLLWKERLWLWAPQGYEEVDGVSAETIVHVLTPRSTVNALKAGYLPSVGVPA